MTREEALGQIEKGNKITHRNFTKGEYLETELETFETQFFAKAIAHFLVELGLICDKHEIQIIGGVIPVIMDLEGNELWQGQERDLHTKWADLYYGDVYELCKWLEDDAGYRHQYFEYTNENKRVV